MDQTGRIRAVRRKLLAWWRAEARAMPWRGCGDPYAVWVSEIMLQQTRAATVREYFPRFVGRFPTVAALAKAPVSAVLKVWEGLGYYRRARNLHAAAKVVQAKFGGEVPGDVESLRTLPGVGAYTAGAIASIAFGLDEPVVDGNVIRVLARVFRVTGTVGRAEVQKQVWSLARALIPEGRAGEFNQALMDLGAMVCLPRKPQCLLCCLADACAAKAAGCQLQLPNKAPRKAVPHYDIVAGVICKGGRILIARRRADAMLGGLWEFPGGKIEPGESHEEALVREIREEVGVRVTVGEPIATVRHAYSHFRITMHVYECAWRSGKARPIGGDAVRWVWPSQLTRYAFPRANGRVVEMLENDE